MHACALLGGLGSVPVALGVMGLTGPRPLWCPLWEPVPALTARGAVMSTTAVGTPLGSAAPCFWERRCQVSH